MPKRLNDFVDTLQMWIPSKNIIEKGAELIKITNLLLISKTDW